MTRNARVFALKYTPKVIPSPVVVHTPPPQERVFVVVPTVPVEMSKGTNSSTTEAATSKGKEVAKKQEHLTA